MEDKNNVIVGNKPFKAYKTYVLSLISSGQLKNLKIQARGPKNVYKALSLAEVIKRTNKGIEPRVVTTTEELEAEDGKRMITAVEITFTSK